MKGRNQANQLPPDVQAEVSAAHRENREIVLSKEVSEKLGHVRRAPVKAVREFCVSCMGGNQAEVRRCTSVGCSLWPFRFGKNPFHQRKKGAS